MNTRTLVVLALMTALAGCFSERQTGPGEAVTFAADIQPIFSGSCAFSGCHSAPGANPANKPMLLTVGQAYDNVVNVPSGQVPSMDRIEPGNPNLSYLIRKLEGTHTQIPGSSGSRMPIGNPLSAATMNTLRQWVTEGAQRN